MILMRLFTVKDFPHQIKGKIIDFFFIGKIKRDNSLMKFSDFHIIVGNAFGSVKIGACARYPAEHFKP